MSILFTKSFLGTTIQFIFRLHFLDVVEFLIPGKWTIRHFDPRNVYRTLLRTSRRHVSAFEKMQHDGIKSGTLCTGNESVILFVPWTNLIIRHEGLFEIATSKT